MIIYCLDLVGVFAFAFFGSRVGLDQKFNILGVLACAFLAAVGGGTIREVMLNRTPFYFQDYSYSLVILLSVLLSIALYQRFQAIRLYVLVLDAVGLVAFAFIGARAAEEADLGPIGVVFFAVLTACGGGVLCELVARKVPRAFREGLYILPPIALGITYWLLGDVAQQQAAVIVMLGATFTLQLAVVYLGVVYLGRNESAQRGTAIERWGQAAGEKLFTARVAKVARSYGPGPRPGVGEL